LLHKCFHLQNTTRLVSFGLQILINDISGSCPFDHHPSYCQSPLAANLELT